MTKVKRRRKSVDVCWDLSLESDLADVRDRLAAYRLDTLDGNPDAVALAKREREILAAVEEATETLTFEGIGTGRLRLLLGKHKPDKQARDEGRVGQLLIPQAGWVEYDADTFCPALLAESCVEPDEFTEDDAAELLSEHEVATIERVWAACLAANLGERGGPKGLSATARRLLGETSATQPQSTESPAASSSGGASEPRQSTSMLLDG